MQLSNSVTRWIHKILAQGALSDAGTCPWSLLCLRLSDDLTHVSLVKYISVNWAIIGSDNGFSPVLRQSIIQANVCFLSVGP